MRAAVILSQIRERCGHLAFDALAVSCGTCLESLAAMQADSMLDGPIANVSRLAVECGLNVATLVTRMYHAPCHDFLDGQGEALLARLGKPVVAVPHGCGEAGTLALSRPDIAGAMRSRKGDAIQVAIRETGAEKIVLTNCPAWENRKVWESVPGIWPSSWPGDCTEKDGLRKPKCGGRGPK